MFKMMINKVSGFLRFNAGSAKNHQKVSPSTNGNVELQKEKCDNYKLELANIELLEKTEQFVQLGRKLTKLNNAGSIRTRATTWKSKQSQLEKLAKEYVTMRDEIRELRNYIMCAECSEEKPYIVNQDEREDSSASAPISSSAEETDVPEQELVAEPEIVPVLTPVEPVVIAHTEYVIDGKETVKLRKVSHVASSPAPSPSSSPIQAILAQRREALEDEDDLTDNNDSFLNQSWLSTAESFKACRIGRQTASTKDSSATSSSCAPVSTKAVFDVMAASSMLRMVAHTSASTQVENDDDDDEWN